MQQPQQQRVTSFGVERQPMTDETVAPTKHEAPVQDEQKVRIEEIRAKVAETTRDMTADQVKEYSRASFKKLVDKTDTLAVPLRRKKKADEKMAEIERQLAQAEEERASMKFAGIRSALKVGKLPALDKKIKDLQEAQRRQVQVCQAENKAWLAGARVAKEEIQEKYGLQFSELSAVEQAKRALEEAKANPVTDKNGVALDCQSDSALVRGARQVVDFWSHERGRGGNEIARQYLVTARNIRTLIAEGKDPCEHEMGREVRGAYELGLPSLSPNTQENRKKLWLSVADNLEVTAAQYSDDFDHDSHQENNGGIPEQEIRDATKKGDREETAAKRPAAKKKSPSSSGPGM